ncbi:MAG: glycosyltransferase family 10 domain-containing protein, partial [Myxococcota bacterium]
PEPDYWVITNHVAAPAAATVDPRRVWNVNQEPPDPAYGWLMRASRGFARVYAPGAREAFPGHVPHHGMLQWHVNRSFDELTSCAPPEKSRPLSWVTSDRRHLPGHRRRLRFLGRIRGQIEFDLFGRGFTPLADKWDGLAPYRYSLAIENRSSPHYWTEKVADCFLAWTMPVYYGATNLADYFPPESYVWLDIDDRHAPARLAEIVRSDRAERAFDALAEARRRVLFEHQFFPRMAGEIERDAASSAPPAPRRVELAAVRDETSRYVARPWRKLWQALRWPLP